MLFGKTKLHIYTLTNALVNDNKRCPFNNKAICCNVRYLILTNILLHVIYKTGDVCYCGYIPVSLRAITDGRGFIVAYIQMILINTQIVGGVLIQRDKCITVKKAKYLNGKTLDTRRGFIFYSGHIVREVIQLKNLNLYRFRGKALRISNVLSNVGKTV